MDNLPTLARHYWAVLAVVGTFLALTVVMGGDTGAMQGAVNDAFGAIVELMATVLFWPIPGISAVFPGQGEIPLVVAVLSFGAIFFTLRFKFINFRGVGHAVRIVSGKYDDPDAPGEVSHFQALSSALSATIGLGNIAGVAIAVAVGGPGAVFWMMVAAVFGMTSKFTECTLGQMYRQVDDKGVVRGGPMVYLREGLAEMGWPRFGKALSVTFAVLCIGGSFGGGNMFQANQSFQAMATIVPVLGGEKATSVVRIWSDEPTDLTYRKHLVKFEAPTPDGALTFAPAADVERTASDWTQDGARYYLDVEATAVASGEEFNVDAGAVTALSFATVVERRAQWAPSTTMTVENLDKFRGGTAHLGWLFGLLLAVAVGVVIVGGIRRIGRVADRLVPAMCLLYVVSSVAILIILRDQVPDAVVTIFREAFSPSAAYGGLIGVIVQGIRRAAFSNEAGVGSAAIAHSASKTKYLVREGLVALLEPFIDTIIICFMTGIVIVVSGVYNDPANATLEGVTLTTEAFSTALGDYSAYLLSTAVFLFAFSTMICWSYYGERCWSFLFGNEQTMPYRILFCVFVWLGCVASMQNVVDFSDLMILSMAFPNIVGMVLLSGKVKRALEDYWSRYTAGEFDD